MLKPGDVLRSKVHGEQSFDWTGIVIAIDRGETSEPGSGRRSRPATVTLLIDGPRMITRELGWIGCYTTTVIDATSDDVNHRITFLPPLNGCGA